MNRRRPGCVPAVVSLVVALAVLSVGCSISTDAQPRDLAVSSTSTSVPATPTTGGARAYLYYVLDGQLVPVLLPLSDHQIETVLNALLKAPTLGDRTKDLTTSIPVGTRLTSRRPEDGTLSLDLSGDFDNVVGPNRQQAIAQIVMTATEFPEVDRVRFSVDGKPVQVATPARGDAAVVTDCDYRSLLAKPADVEGTPVGAATVQRLTSRQNSLRSCPTSG